MAWDKGKHRGGKTIDGSRSKETKEGHAVSYITRMNKCNNPRCKVCKEEGGGHGPYWYKVYRTPEGKVKTEYYGKVAPEEEDQTDSNNSEGNK